MGVKRPFEEEFQESSTKQAKQLDSDNVWSSVTDDISSDKVTETACDRGEAADNFDKFLLLKDYENEPFHATSSLADKELETSVPLSWVTSSSSEEDVGSRELFPSLFAEYFPFSFPRRTVHQVEDVYSSLMNSSPRKQIPIGPDNQADIPPWDPNTINDENDERVGTCVVSPESLSEDPSYGDAKIGQGRKECNCLDVGCVRCVRQHVKEGRDEVRKAFGDEKFSDLGFYEMGEEVACKWTEEEEGIFHEIIYSNPMSLGRNFWRILPGAFPCRTMKELTSYYFNVFMLRRRAVQNRSRSLEIDSDDDEWHGHERSSFGRVGDDEEFAIESFGDQVGSEDDMPYGDGDDEDEDEDDSDDGDGDDEVGGEVDGGGNGEDGNSKDDLRGQTLRPHVYYQLHDDMNSERLVKMENPSEMREDHNALEDSSTSCESQLYAGGSCISFGLGHDTGTHRSTMKDDLTGSLTGESNDSSDGLDSGFFLHTGDDTKVWDESCSRGLARGVDLLPTCNMIEEIFGPCSSKSN